jgi:hypothetical protein
MERYPNAMLLAEILIVVALVFGPMLAAAGDVLRLH